MSINLASIHNPVYLISKGKDMRQHQDDNWQPAMGIKLLLRVARFKRQARALPEIEIPQAVRAAAEANGFVFINVNGKVKRGNI